MKMIPLALIILILSTGLSISPLVTQGQELPINPNTHLVSISNVIVVSGTNQQEIKHRIEEWLALRSNSFQTLFNNTQNSRKKKKGKNLAIPSFSYEKKLDSDAKSVYFLLMDNTPSMSRMEINLSKSGTAKTVIQFNLIVLIKDGKVKYELTNFAHISTNPTGEAAGGPFENEKPDAKRRYLTRSDWREQKQQAIEKVKVLAHNFEQYILHPSNTDMNF
ncbi:hypothetical protein HGH93_08615 [Chitinophaga polysaccharea]|uniref:hypothetical protein n=1 Tax=Chitinophaga polysaccharea TaxID=1293035 RepID=UPI001454FF5D|nr:hypothetical protein [Chitinophaga polysaccharea]NLR58157.1 hypothetical protein [Chitinophaga polysaccharea]